jgi:TPR repeat protein
MFTGFAHPFSMEAHGDSTDAIDHLRISAQQARAQSQYNYGVCLRNGEGVSVDFVQSAYYFKLAADQGDPREPLRIKLFEMNPSF